MKKAKIFEFKKDEFVDLTNTPEFGCNVIQCGEDKYTLKDFRLQVGHDDSLPYAAILCVNGKELCGCFNDGWGGQTEIKGVNKEAWEVMRNKTDMLSNYGWSYMGTKFHLDLDFIADTLAITESHRVK